MTYNISPNRALHMSKAFKLIVTSTLTALTACTPTVQVAVPNEPITINLNVRIEHEIRVQVEEDLDDIFSANSGLF